MKCMVCGSAAAAGSSVCPVCGFPHIKAVGNGERAKYAPAKFAVLYKGSVLGKVEILLRIYGYKRTEQGLEPVKEELLPLAEYINLKEKEIVWNARRFARIRRKDGKTPALRLEILIRNGEKEETVRTEIVPPVSDSDWHIGITRGREGIIVLHVGTPERSAAGREIDLFACPAVRQKTSKGGASA